MVILFLLFAIAGVNQSKEAEVIYCQIKSSHLLIFLVCCSDLIRPEQIFTDNLTFFLF